MKGVVDEIREEGKKNGLIKGERNKGIKIAINMIKLGKNTYDDIAECTELPLSEILELAKQIKPK